MERNMTEKQENRLIAATLFVFFVSGASSALLGNLMPFLRETYDISYSRAGMLMSLPSWGNLASIYIAGYLPTYIGRRKTVLLTSVWMVLAFSIIGFGIGGASLLTAACVMIGIARGGNTNFSNTMMSTLPGNKSAVGYNLLHGAFALGAVLSPIVLIGLTSAFPGGWRYTSFCIVGLCILQMMVYGRMHLPKESITGSIRQVDRTFLKNRNFWLAAAILFFYISAEYAIVTWLVTYFKDTGILSANVSQLMTSLLWVVIFAGRMIGAAIVSKVSRNPSLQMISFTITEKGYALKDIQGNFFPVVEEDFEKGPDFCNHAMSIVTAMLNERFLCCGAPLAVVSMDNCSHNGEKLRESVMTIAKKWRENRFVSEGFLYWLSDEENVSLPWSMIDKITPRPAAVVEEALNQAGLEDMAPVVTSKGTFIAPFVNAEQPQYLVVEDRFPNGRPPLEKAGVYMTDRETVNKTETMKVTTCLNPLHTALAVYGCMLGYTSIAAEMKDPQLKKLVEGIGYTEGLSVVVDPGILSPRDFLNEVVEQRLPNPFIPDMPQRIATDTSQKVPIRFGETIKSYLADPQRNAADLKYIPLALAGWLRYLLALDAAGNAFACSSDPMLEVLQNQLASVKLGEPETATDAVLQPILSNPALFAVNLYEAGLAEKVTEYLRKMLAGPGAVRATLVELV